MASAKCLATLYWLMTRPTRTPNASASASLPAAMRAWAAAERGWALSFGGEVKDALRQRADFPAGRRRRPRRRRRV